MWLCVALAWWPVLTPAAVLGQERAREKQDTVVATKEGQTPPGERQPAPAPKGPTNFIAKFGPSTTLVPSSIIDNGTNVGIGTNSPGGIGLMPKAKLEIRGVGDPLLLLNHVGPAGNPALWFQQDGATKAYVWWDQLNNRLNLGSLSVNPILSLHNSGVVGIGTMPDPKWRLTLSGNIRLIKGAIIFPDGTTQSTAQVPGTSGPQGPRGPQGPPGPPGPVPMNTVAVCGPGNTCVGVCQQTIIAVKQTTSSGGCQVTAQTGSCSYGGVPGVCCVCGQ